MPEAVVGMDEPYYYRNKVHRALTKDNSGNIISGPYEAGSHWIIDIDRCLIEDLKAQEAADIVKDTAADLRIRIYNEKTGRGDLRRILIRRAASTGEIMAVLVCAGGSFPQKREFAARLMKKIPDIKTVVLNINSRHTSMILGEREEVLSGCGYITDVLCGLRFRISASSFYQINPVQTELLYKTALEFADLKGGERVIDAYCGIGTIGLAAAAKMGGRGRVTGIELNPAAVKDARLNAEENGIRNAEFYCADAGGYMKKMAADGEKADVVFMDPPRSGASISFMKSAVRLAPEKIIYISCGPESLARNLKFFKENGYEAVRCKAVDMFPHTSHVECCCLMSQVKD